MMSCLCTSRAHKACLPDILISLEVDGPLERSFSEPVRHMEGKLYLVDVSEDKANRKPSSHQGVCVNGGFILPILLLHNYILVKHSCTDKTDTETLASALSLKSLSGIRLHNIAFVSHYLVRGMLHPEG